MQWYNKIAMTKHDEKILMQTSKWTKIKAKTTSPKKASFIQENSMTVKFNSWSTGKELSQSDLYYWP